MIHFNVPPFVGTEFKYMHEAVENQKICGDGPFTKKCNEWLEKKFNANRVMLTTSGSTALDMAALLCGIKPGDEVILPSFTFSSTANSFVLAGAKLVFVDIRPDTMNIDETKIEAAITEKTKVICPVHYAGVACEMDTIMDIAKKHNLMVVEDAAQGVMSTYKGRALGTIGDFGCYSFHETKNYSMGEGGAIVINNPTYIEKAEILREKGTNRSQFFRGQVAKYNWVDEVHGIVRRASISNTARIDHLIEKNAIHLHDGDLSDSSGLIRLVGEIKPDEIYNLAAQSHVQVSFDAPEYSGDVDALGVLRVLEAVRVCGLTKTCKVYQASTSELYGKVEEVPQRETTPFHPYSPYAVAKQYGFWMVKEYRDAYGMFAVNGILFNHESERRGENFVTRKITLAAGRIAEGLQDHLELGNMDSLRDWGYAKDYVECMWLIMQQEKPDDFVIATGVQHTVRDFTEKAFAANGITLRWEGTGIDEKGYDAATGKMLVCVNPQWFRPTDVDNLWGDPTKAKTVLGWNPQSTTYEQLVEIMAKHDRERAKREKALKAVL